MLRAVPLPVPPAGTSDTVSTTASSSLPSRSVKSTSTVKDFAESAELVAVTSTVVRPSDAVAGVPSRTSSLASTPLLTSSNRLPASAVFAGVLMLVNGVLAIFQGISLLAKDDVWTRVGDYVYEINLTGWGVILLCLGALAVVTGAFVLKGAAWARMTGIFLASLSMIAQFLFLPYAPFWSLIMVGVDFFVIWALAVYKPEKRV